MRGSDFLKTVIEKEERAKIKAMEDDAVQVHRDFCVITKCEDSTRNNETVLNKSKLSYIDRENYRIKSIYDGLIIEKNGVVFKIKDITRAKVKHKGYILKARAIDPAFDNLNFETSEKEMKRSISRGYIKIQTKKDQHDNTSK